MRKHKYYYHSLPDLENRTCASVSESPNNTSAIDLHLKIPNSSATRLAVHVQAK